MMWLASSTILSRVVGQSQPIIVKKKNNCYLRTCPPAGDKVKTTRISSAQKLALSISFLLVCLYLSSRSQQDFFMEIILFLKNCPVYFSLQGRYLQDQGRSWHDRLTVLWFVFWCFFHKHKDKHTQTHDNKHTHSIVISGIIWWWSRIDTSGKGNFYIIVWRPFLIGFFVVIIHFTHNIFAFITVAIVKVANSISSIVIPPYLTAKLRLNMQNR